MAWESVNSFDMQMESIMIKGHGNVRKRTQKGIRRLKHIKVYRDEVRASKRYTFFNVEFRGIACFYQVFCQQSAVPDCGQDIG